ncbi:retrovirus-related pol polyprotein from transposon TNT 1-94 [Tanacetum coccineum]|uniref:Retrovirus-related pol polyprotein from transposon TNT 1-94 n=1 Tax=Tanacetum coccineum TaxID=301880 RepID=A0ABQ4XRU2_9ASTR
MFLNVDQLEKQLDKEEFQEIGSMAAFRHMESVKKSIDKRALHKREYDSRVNERQMQTTEGKVDTSKALDASLADTESSRTESRKQDTSSRSGNDADADDADIKPVYDEEPMTEVQLIAKCNVFATGQKHTEQPEFNNEGEVDQNVEQCHDKRPLPAKLTDNQITELSYQSLESKNIYVIETINIELEHKVAKLLKENETLKKHYKELYDSIKTMRAKTIEKTTSLIAQNAEFKAQLQEKGFAIATLKNELRKLTGNSVNTKFAKPSILGKPILNPLRNQSIVRQLTAFNSERPRISKQRESRSSSKNMPRFSSNDMVHNHYLEEAKKKTQERGRNSRPSVMPSAKSQSTANDSKPKPRINNQKSRNWLASKTSYIATKTVPIVEHSRNSRNFSDNKHFVFSTCQKCVFNANHDTCVMKFMNEVNSRAKVPSHKTTQRYKPVEQISISKKPDRQIPKGRRFSIKKTSTVHEKTKTPRSCLRWKLIDITNLHECIQTLDLSAGTSINVHEEQNLDLSAVIPLGQKNTLAEYMILFDANNRPPMLGKDLYDSWKSIMELYMQNREHGRMILESVENGPLIWPTIEENGVTKIKKYAKLSAAEIIQADCDMKATNIILQGLPADIYSLVNHHRVAKDLWERIQLLMQGTSLTKQERECKLYDAFDKFTHIKGESLHKYYLRFTQLINDMNIYNMKMDPSSAWNYQDPLAFVANQQMTPPHFNTYQSSYNNPQLQQQFPPSQYGSIHPNQHYSSTYPSQPQFNHSSVQPSYLYQSQMNHQTSSVPQIAYQSPQVTTQPMTESPLVDSGFVVPVFSLGDDPIACLNKAMAFLTVVASSRVTVQQVQGRQGQSYSRTGYKSNTTSYGGNNASGHAKVVKSYNCQGEGHMARQCTQPKRPRNAAWYKDKAMLAEAQEAGQILDEEQLAFLAEPEVPNGQVVHTIIPNNAAFQTEDLDTYDSECDDISNAKAVLMANISNYGSDVISQVLHSETDLNDMENQGVHVMQDFKQMLVVDFIDNEIHSDINIIPYSHYLQETQQENVQDTNLQA